VLTSEGTLVMPTHTADLSDPAHWQHPPVPEAWWDEMRETMPAYDPDLTPVFRMGMIAETFRKQRGVLRSNHPNVSFAAWGKHAREITEDHALVPFFGERSPLARVYALDGWVLLLGVGHGNNTSLHIAEVRANIPHPVISDGAPILVDGARQWVTYEDFDVNDEDFVALGADFACETGLQRGGQVGRADCILVPQRLLIDYGVPWLERHRGGKAG
jgi:aminoglycoside 3-N-acetyltransferase